METEYQAGREGPSRPLGHQGREDHGGCDGLCGRHDHHVDAGRDGRERPEQQRQRRQQQPRLERPRFPGRRPRWQAPYVHLGAFGCPDGQDRRREQHHRLVRAGPDLEPRRRLGDQVLHRQHPNRRPSAGCRHQEQRHPHRRLGTEDGRLGGRRRRRCPLQRHQRRDAGQVQPRRLCPHRRLGHRPVAEPPRSEPGRRSGRLPVEHQDYGRHHALGPSIGRSAKSPPGMAPT